MKRALKIGLGLILILVVVFFLGPRPDGSYMITFNKTDLGNDLDTYLSNEESAVTELIPGAEKEIIWNNPVTKAKTPYSIVYAHGFSASKYETRPVPDLVAKEIGANLYYTRFQGHGHSNGDRLADATVEGWANDFAEAMAIGERIGEKTILIATSNGATITTSFLSEPGIADTLAGIVFMSPNFELAGLPTNVGNMPWAEALLPMLAGERRSWEPENEEHGKWWTTSYPSIAIFPMMALLAKVEDTDKSTINIPTAFIYSPQDEVVSVTAIENAISQWGGETRVLKVEVEEGKSNHVIAGDIRAPENNATVVDFIVDWFGKLDD